MKFVVSRASAWSDDVCPCEGAKRIVVNKTDIRTVPAHLDMAKFYSATNWYKRGTNHRVLNDGRIARDIQENLWVITISHLKNLMEFIDKYGQVVVSHYPDTQDLPEIMIYDDYIE